MKDKRFYYTKHFSSASPLLMEELDVQGTASIENDKVTGITVHDILYKGTSVYNLLRLIAPDKIKECEDSALEVCKNKTVKDVKPHWVVKKEARDAKSDKAVASYMDEMNKSGDELKAREKFFDAHK